jgi:hypothetical protein
MKTTFLDFEQPIAELEGEIGHPLLHVAAARGADHCFLRCQKPGSHFDGSGMYAVTTRTLSFATSVANST